MFSAAILEAGRLAPSTVNLQTWAFAVFDAALWQQTFGHAIPFHGSRAVIVIADTFRDRQVLDVFPYSPLVEHTVAVMNASLAAMNMNIAAEALGVSSVMLSETGRSGLAGCQILERKAEPAGKYGAADDNCVWVRTRCLPAHAAQTSHASNYL